MTTDIALRPADARDAVLALLSARAPGATICPSEVARALAADDPGRADGDWRALMPAVHDAVDQLADEGKVRLSWKRRPLAVRAGRYRIARA